MEVFNKRIFISKINPDMSRDLFCDEIFEIFNKFRKNTD